jgi:hypothetical protein
MQTNLKDCNGISIKAGDIVRDNEGFTGKVLFINGAWRYDVLEGRLLKFNSSLLFKEGIGTSHLEVIAQDSQTYKNQDPAISFPRKDNYKSNYTERHT